MRTSRKHSLSWHLGGGGGAMVKIMLENIRQMTSMKAICSEGTVNIWSLHFPKGRRSILIHVMTLEPRSNRDGKVNHVRVLESSARQSEGQWTRPPRNTAQHISMTEKGMSFSKANCANGRKAEGGVREQGGRGYFVQGPQRAVRDDFSSHCY